MEQTKQSVMKSGSLNPMWGKQHDQKTKEKISNSQKIRYAAIRKALKTEEVLSLGRTDKAARMDLLDLCLNTDAIAFETIEQAHNFMAIMLQEGDNYLKSVIKEELNKFLDSRNRHL